MHAIAGPLSCPYSTALHLPTRTGRLADTKKHEGMICESFAWANGGLGANVTILHFADTGAMDHHWDRQDGHERLIHYIIH